MAKSRQTAGAALVAVLLASVDARAEVGVSYPLMVFTAREQLLAVFDHIPEPDLAAAVLHCDRVARETMLGFDEGVLCAMAWDALLRRVFANDVDALMAWWRVRRDANPSR